MTTVAMIGASPGPRGALRRVLGVIGADVLDVELDQGTLVDDTLRQVLGRLVEHADPPTARAAG